MNQYSPRLTLFDGLSLIQINNKCSKLRKRALKLTYEFSNIISQMVTDSLRFLWKLFGLFSFLEILAFKLRASHHFLNLLVTYKRASWRLSESICVWFVKKMFQKLFLVKSNDFHLYFSDTFGLFTGLYRYQ